MPLAGSSGCLERGALWRGRRRGDGHLSLRLASSSHPPPPTPPYLERSGADPKGPRGGLRGERIQERFGGGNLWTGGICSIPSILCQFANVSAGLGKFARCLLLLLFPNKPCPRDTVSERLELHTPFWAQTSEKRLGSGLGFPHAGFHQLLENAWSLASCLLALPTLDLDVSLFPRGWWSPVPGCVNVVSCESFTPHPLRQPPWGCEQFSELWAGERVAPPLLRLSSCFSDSACLTPTHW